MNLISEKIPVDKDRIKRNVVPNLDYSKIKKYWNNVIPTILGPYMMDGFGFPIGAGHTRFLDESKIIKKLTVSIKSSSSVLDLGSGIGSWTKYFANHYNEVVSVESSNILYESLQNRFSKNSKVKTIHTDALSFKSNKKYGIIFLGGLLMYLNQKDAVMLLKKIASWLEPGGKIICRESTVRRGIIIRKSNYQVIYRSLNHYESIFKKSYLFLETEELNNPYVSAQMSCEAMNKWKKNIPQKYWNLPVIGFIAYWFFRLGYPKNIKFWTTRTKKIGLEFPKLLNHFFVLRPKCGMN